MKFIIVILFLVFPLFLKAQEIQQSFHSFDGTNIAYSDQGKGHPVLLIHGFISDGSSWDKTMLKQALLDSGYHVIIPDLRGNGKSDKPHNPEAYAHDAEIKDLMALADHLGLKAFSAIGYSRGSIVLAKWLTKEKRIDKAVIGGMGLDFTNPNWDRRIMFAKVFGGQAAITPETSGAVNYAKSIGADFEVLSLLQQYQPVTTQSALRKINVETLIIAGDADHADGSPKELQQCIPNSMLKIVPGDHGEAKNSLEFAKAVMKFLDAD